MSSSQVGEALARLPDYLGSHVLVSLTALAIGLAVSLPLALASLKRPVLRSALLTTTSVIQTVPGLALLALFYPLLLALAALSERLVGWSFSALGFLPAVLALALYSMLPVVRNTITGIEGVPVAVRQAAVGVGMTARQSLLMVELPLALPVIMAGVRTAAVWVIGTATLSTPIGQQSLGNYIFTGLQTQNWVFVLFGCAAAAVLALAVDQMLALMENGAAARRNRWIGLGAAGLVLIGSLGVLPWLGRASGGYVIGSKAFSEQYVLASLIERRLGGAGMGVQRRDGLGSAVIFDALAAGEIDVYVDYSGTIWANQMKREGAKPRQQLMADVRDWLANNTGVRMVGGLGFENAYGLAVSQKRAASGIRSIADLASRAGGMSIAGDYEFFGRPEWRAIRSSYGLSFKQERQMQAEFMYPAAAAGEVDVLSAYTSDGRIAKYGLVVLEDPRQAIPPYDAIILVSAKRAKDEALLRALRTLVGRIDVKTMQEANRRVSDGASPAEAAQWLDARIGGVTK